MSKKDEAEALASYRAALEVATRDEDRQAARQKIDAVHDRTKVRAD